MRRGKFISLFSFSAQEHASSKNRHVLNFRVMAVCDIMLWTCLSKNIYPCRDLLWALLEVKVLKCLFKCLLDQAQIISGLIAKWVPDVYTISRPPCWCSMEVHQHGGSILCKLLRRIFEDQENVQTLKLEKCHSKLSLITIWFLEFTHWMVFELFFNCVTVQPKNCLFSHDVTKI